MDSSRPAPHACGACPTLVGFQGFLTFQWNSLFRSSPFTTPNSRSPPKFDHSLSFTLLLKYTRATLHHGRPCPGPSLNAPSPSNPCSAPSLPATRDCEPLTTHSLPRAPLFSYSYELLFPQPLCFDNDPHCPGVCGTNLRFARMQTCKSFVSYHIPANPAVSCNYALFYATAYKYPYYSQ